MQVDSMSYTLLLWALINSGAGSQVINLQWNNKLEKFTPDITKEKCSKSKGHFIKDITFLRNQTCQSSGLSENLKNLEAAIRRGCSRRAICNVTDSLDNIKNSKCGHGLYPISGIILFHCCKPLGVNKISGKGYNMCREFEKKLNHNQPTILTLKSQKHTKTRCKLKSKNSLINLQTLQVDFGSECDTSKECTSLMEITMVDNNTKTTLKRFEKNSNIFSSSNFEINVQMKTGLVWLEVTANSSYTINCKNDSDCEEDNSNDGDKEDTNSGDNNNADDDMDNVTIIVSSAIAVIILICACTVLVCRVHPGVGIIQRWISFDPTGQKKADLIDIGKQGSTSHTTPNHVTKTSAKTFTTDLDQGNYYEIVTTSRNSIHVIDVQPVTSTGTERIYSTTPTPQIAKHPYSKLDRSERKLPGSYVTVGDPQKSELSKLSPTYTQNLVSSSPGFHTNSPTLKIKGTKSEDGAICNTTTAVIEADYSLVSNSNENPSNNLFITLESVDGAYSHLRSTGEQNKIISNVYDG